MSVNHEDPIAAAVSSLTGTVEKITYHSEETGYTVLKLELSPTKKRKSNIHFNYLCGHLCAAQNRGAA